MSKELAIRDKQELDTHFTPKQLDILKNSICKGATNEEFEVFIMACTKTQLDPFMKQIYAVKRWDSRLKKETMTIQTGIDGYRLIAERTERYAPGPKPTFEYDTNGHLVSATAYIKKQTKDGTWHMVEAEAYYDEYCQTTLDKTTGERKTIGMWTNMQRNQLAKCAESLALRKAFPAHMSGVYTKEEMKQAETIEIIDTCTTPDQVQELMGMIGRCPVDYQNRVIDFLNKHGLTDDKIPLGLYNQTYERVSKRLEELAVEMKVEAKEEVASE